MSISPDLIAAINTYYAFLRIPHFRGHRKVYHSWPDTATKHRICQYVTRIAEHEGIRVHIRPGEILLQRGLVSTVITGPIDPTLPQFPPPEEP